MLELFTVMLIAAGILMESRVALFEKKIWLRLRRFLRRCFGGAANPRADARPQYRGQMCSVVQAYAKRRF
jgi:hypothetical protein